MPTDAELMLAIFQGSDLAHGRSEMTQQITSKGKHEAKSWTEKRPAGVPEWTAHLEGRAGIGIMPLNSENKVRWGAIDVDVYNGPSIEKLNAQIQEAKLPLVICRSKSGGPHIFMFLREWVPAKAMIEKLDAIAGFLGFGTSEIFPKQAMISVSEKSTDFGSWINMPYFGGVRFMRYALDENSKALKTIPEFAAYVETRAITGEQFEKLELEVLDVGQPSASSGNGVSKGHLPDGPPCLNRLFAVGVADNRNVVLSNVAVYLKKAVGEGWEAHLDKYNQLFVEPLASGEVETIKKSYSKKDYRFQCSRPPLNAYCNSSACKKVKYGIGGGDLLPTNRSLSMVDTSPPVWFLDLTMPDGNDRRISLSTEELQNPRLFQRRCMEALQQMPPAMKMEEWQPIVQSLMDHVSVIRVPPEMTPQGQFKELLTDFLLTRSQKDSFESLLRGIPYVNTDGYHFRLKDLWSFVRSQQFNLLTNQEMVGILHNDMKAQKGFKTISGSSVRFITVPLFTEKSEEPLAPAQFPTVF